MSKKSKPIDGSEPVHNPLIIMADPLFGITKEIIDQVHPSIKLTPQDLGVFITGTPGIIINETNMP